MRNLIILNYKYKLYIDHRNFKKLNNLIVSANFAWNHIVKLARRYYHRFKKSVKCSRMKQQMSKLAKSNTYWKLLDAQAMQSISEKYQQALENHFNPKMRSGFPRIRKCFKGGSILFKQTGYRLDVSEKDENTGLLYINKLSRTRPFKFKITRMWGEVRNISIKKGKNNTYWLTVCTKVPQEHLERLCNGNIGIDFGLKTFMTISNGEEIVMPDFINDSYKEISNANREISRKYSANVFGTSFKRSAKKMGKAYDNLVNKREDYQWKLAHQLCRENRLISLEDLNLKSMSRRTEKNRKRFGKKVSMLSFGSFVNKLTYIATKYDTEIFFVDRWFPSSQICSTCGYRTDLTKDLSVREWKCPQCHSHHNRDFNAAINILNEALRNLGKGISLENSDGKSSELFNSEAVTVTL